MALMMALFGGQCYNQLRLLLSRSPLWRILAGQGLGGHGQRGQLLNNQLLIATAVISRPRDLLVLHVMPKGRWGGSGLQRYWWARRTAVATTTSRRTLTTLTWTVALSLNIKKYIITEFTVTALPRV